jgi:hypothetical protein
LEEGNELGEEFREGGGLERGFPVCEENNRW